MAKTYQIYAKFFIYTKSKIYIPSTLKICQIFPIWYIHIYTSWQHCVALFTFSSPNTVFTYMTFSGCSKNAFTPTALWVKLYCIHFGYVVITC